MDINVDFSFFPDNLMHIVISSSEIKSCFLRSIQSSSIINNNSQKIINPTISIFEFPGTLKEFEDLLNCILQKDSIKEYVAVQDTERENTLALLKHGDIEQLGILSCDFCGAVFNSEDEKYIHQRAHYLF
jgi:hypothetical protein